MIGGVMGVVVPRNTSIPTIKKRIFTTTQDNQTTVEFPIYEGERTMTKDNNLLGKFTLSGILPQPRNVPELEVTFDLNADGILEVTAIDKSSGRQANITISNSTGHLSAAEIERMVADGERYKQEDKTKEEAVQAKQALEQSIYHVEENLSNPKITDRLPRSDRQALENALSEALEFLEITQTTAENKDKITNTQKKLERTAQRAFANLRRN